MAFEPRTSESRALAEKALIGLATAVGSHRDELIVIGGLNPELLTRPLLVRHQGTNDVDVLLAVGLPFERDDMDFSWLERGLTHLGYVVDPTTGDGWRWIAEIDGFSVRVEFLCDVHGDQRNYTLALPGCDITSAKNLQGPGAALRDARTVALMVPEELGGGSVEIRFAGLGGYLLAKAAAVSQRQLERDYYDFAFVLLFNTAGGPAAAATAVSKSGASDLFPRYRRFVEHAVRLYVGPKRPAAHAFAHEMRQTGDPTDHDTLVEDATGAATEFWTAIEPE